MKAVRGIFWFLLIPVVSVAHTFQIFEENGKVGLKNEQGVVMIPAQYESLGWSDGTFAVVNQVTGYQLKGKWGLIGLDNKKIAPAHFESLLPGEGSVLIAQRKADRSIRVMTGCVTTQGKEVIPFMYDGIRVQGMRAIVFTKIGSQYKFGVVDLEHKTIIPQQYKSIQSMGSLRFAVENFDHKIALFADQGKQLTDFIIDSLSAFRKNYAVIYQNNLQGIVDRDGDIRIEPRYREVRLDDAGTIRVRDADTWLLIDGKNTTHKSIVADNLIPLAENRLLVATASQWQLTNNSFAPLSANKFSWVGAFEKANAVVHVRGKSGVINTQGDFVIKPLYDSLIRISHHYLAMQRQHSKTAWMLLDTIGNVLSDRSYDAMVPLNGTFLTVRNRGYAGAINLQGDEVIACTYDSLLQTRDELLVVKFRGQYGIITLAEEWKVTPRNNKLMLLGDGRYLELTTKTKFLKSLNGTVIYFTDNPLDIHDTHFVEHLPSGTVWKIDRDGRIVDRQLHPEEQIETISEEHEGYRAIMKDGRAGFVDSQGRLRIANRYEAVRAFHEGLAPMKIRGHWGYLNKEDKIAIQPVYDEVSFFSNGFAYVKQKGLFGIIDKYGKEVLPVRYEAATILPTGNVLIMLNGLAGLANASGKVLIQPRYQHLQDVGEGYTIVNRDGKYGVVTYQGISTIPLMYDYIRYDPFQKLFLVQKKSSWQEIKF